MKDIHAILVIAERIMRRCNDGAGPCPLCEINYGEHESGALCDQLEKALRDWENE